MGKMWTGRTSGRLDPAADSFNSSISFDKKMWRQDIVGSTAHAAMLGEQRIIPVDDVEKIIKTLGEIADDIESGKLLIDEQAEDIHMFIEGELTNRIGDAGKRLHTARSRNDQVATDLRLYLRNVADKLKASLFELIGALYGQAEKNKATVMPGYTHMQRAQPVTLAFHLLAYCEMFLRDIGRLNDAVARMNYSPLGACAMSGTTYPIDRKATASSLGFDGICRNACDAVSDRDFCVELEATAALIMTHLSRLSEELILWSSWEFSFIELDDSYTTGSSIMPQKKNSDMAELIRGKTGRVDGDLMATLVMLKGLPLAYNKDMQEDKEAVFDAVDTTHACIEIMSGMISTMKVKPQNMLAAAGKGFINATDLADHLTSKGLPFRTAYKLVGQIVAGCIKAGTTLENLPICEYKKLAEGYEEYFTDALYEVISLEKCVERRISEGSAGYKSTQKQLDFFADILKTKA